MPEDTNIPKLAFLGPPGSHSYQCALNRFGSSVEYVDRQTITDVFDAVSHDVPIALIPQENSIYGIVTETYDLLRRPDVGKDKLNVRRVLSHEQALGQCAQFLSEKLPAAARVKVSSTSAAAQSLLSSADECDSAAICSSSCASLFDGLEVLYENIQDKDTNLTRFYIIAHSSIVDLPSAPLETQQIPSPYHQHAADHVWPASDPYRPETIVE
ncbi:P-protein [Grifola frondosa]|uniref:p-protein n=1 Tax=Grifola frondosa TaxID=5627 RepID=A0A1C7MT88_GRIFR|nr:P-protein [Grifola frondosa]